MKIIHQTPKIILQLFSIYFYKLYIFINYMLSEILNMVHVCFLFIPMIVYLIPRHKMPQNFIYMYLGIMLVPLHWGLFDDMCLFTILTQKVGGLQDPKTESAFSEVYMRWLYEPFMKMYGAEWNNNNLNKAIYVHWIVIFVLLWYYMFFYNKQLMCKIV